MFVFKDADTKDDPVYKFGDDDDDDELLRQVLPDPVTKPHTSPSCEDSTETVNPVQGPACATQTGPTSRKLQKNFKGNNKCQTRSTPCRHDKLNCYTSLDLCTE